jgi:hypothetical protein
LQSGVITVIAEKPPFAPKASNGTSEAARLRRGPQEGLGQTRSQAQAVSCVKWEPGGSRDGARVRRRIRVGPGRRFPDSEWCFREEFSPQASHLSSGRIRENDHVVVTKMTRGVETGARSGAPWGGPQEDELVQVNPQAGFHAELTNDAQPKRFSTFSVTTRQLVVSRRIPDQQNVRRRKARTENDNPGELRRETRGSELGDASGVQHTPGLAAGSTSQAIQRVL